jgi:HEAT repeat protein
LARKALDRIEPDWPHSEGARLAVPGLVARLSDAGPQVRRAAVETLDLVDPNWPHHPENRGVIRELVLRLAEIPNVSGEQGPADVLTTLARIDPQWPRSAEARTAAPALVGRLAQQPRDAAEAGWLAVDTLARLGQTAADTAPDLRRLLADSSQAVRCQALTALAAVQPDWSQTSEGRQAFDDLLNLLGDGRRDGAALALRALNRVSPPDRPAAVRKLILALPGDEVLKTLTKIDPNWSRSPGAVRAESELVVRFRLGEPDRRIEAAWVLAQLGAPAAAAVPDLIAALTDSRGVAVIPEQPVRTWIGEPERATVNQAALRALEEIDPNWARSPAARKVQGDLVRWLAGVDSLDPVPGETPVRRALDGIRPDWRQSEAVREAVTGLAKRLSAEDADERRRSLIALGRFGPEGLGQLGPRAATTQTRLVQLRADPAARVRDAAHSLLDLLVPDWTKSPAGARAVPYLVDQLADDDGSVRTAAAAGLAQFDPKVMRAVIRTVPGLVARFVKLCADDSQTVREAALTALEGVDLPWRDSPQGRELFQQLVKQLDGRSSNERKMAAQNLGRLVPLPEDALYALAMLVGDAGQDDLARAAARAISRQGLPLPDRVAGELSRIARKLARQASASELATLRELGPAAKSAVPLLLESLGEEPSLTNELVRTLDAIEKNHWRQSATLEELLPRWAQRVADKDPATHQRGVAILAAVGPLGERGRLAREAIDRLIRDLKLPEQDKSPDDVYDRHSAQAAAAARALGNIGTAAAAAVKPLLQRLTIPLRQVELTTEDKAEFEAIWEALGRVDPHWTQTPAAEGARTVWQKWKNDRSSEAARLQAELGQQWLRRLEEAKHRSEQP